MSSGRSSWLEKVRDHLPRPPRFSVSVQIRETPDLRCVLEVRNPGPAFSIRSARLLTPRAGLIYRREQFLWNEVDTREFTELPIEHPVAAGETVFIPFEVWIPRAPAQVSIRLMVSTSRRLRPYVSTAARLVVPPRPPEAKSPASPSA